MKILFIGDVFGSAGKRILADMLQKLIRGRGIDVCVANVENLAGGRGVTQNLLSKLRHFGVNVVTSGNHVWDNKDGVECLDKDPAFLRPLNYPAGNPGRGSAVFTLPDGRTLGVINLQGRVFMYAIDCPFRAGLAEAARLKTQTDIILVDFHAEATSEKIALGHYLDGKVTAVIGTHTHVQTADEQILPKGTAYLSDAGMTGPHHSVIGMKAEPVIRKFLYEVPVRFEPSEEKLMFNGVLIEADDATGKAVKIERIMQEVTVTGQIND